MPLDTHQPSSSAPPSTTPPTSRIPEYHALGSLTDAKPGTIPLLVQMPDGNREQLDVPLHSTVDDIAASLQKDSNDVFRLSFGNSDLDPSTSLLDTNIVDAYEHAGSLLHLIASGRQDADTKAAALDTACAVVENISNGIKNMEALCAAAMPDTADQQDQPDQPDSPREQVPDVDRSEYPQTSSHTTPSQLAYNLSRRLPNLFPPCGTAAAFPQEDAEQPTIGRQVSIQPSLSSIRDARRRASALRKVQGDDSASKAPDRVPDIAIGESTNVPLPLNLEQSSETQPREGGSSLMLTNSEKATWLEDVMKTWEVDTVRESGILEKSKDGQEISNYLQSLQADAEREIQIEKIDNQHQPSPNTSSSAPGESSDEEDGNVEYQGNTNGKQSSQNAVVPNGQPAPPNGHAKNMNDNSTDELQKSIAAVNISGRNRSRPAAPSEVIEGATRSHHCTTGPSHNSQQPRYASQLESQKHISQYNQEGQSQQPQSIPNQAHCNLQRGPIQKTSAQSKRPVPGKTPSACTTSKTEKSSSSSQDSRSKPQVRQATKIAPAPNVSTSPMPGANGLFTNHLYPGAVPVPSVSWQPKPAATGPKKRGRKRKNPELTEEERALARKEQNRESAKLSRVRRKVIAAEYEGRLNALVDENTMLRKQVEGLNNRLVYLQSLLTISVRQEPPQS